MSDQPAPHRPPGDEASAAAAPPRRATPATALHHLGQDVQSFLDNPHDRAVAPSRLPRPLQIGLVVVFLAFLILATMFLLTEHWRRGVFIVGAAMIYLGVIRWVVDSRIMGVLAVRSRKFDSIFCILLGLAVDVIAYGVDPLL